MNHNCKGDYFTAEDERLYRCDRDGQLTDAPVPFIYCPACGRRVDAVDRGKRTGADGHRYNAFCGAT